MSTRFYRLHRYSTYYFADIISGVLNNPFDYLRSFEGFCGDLNAQYFFRPFPRWSALHQFISFIADSVFWEQDVHHREEYADNDNSLRIEHALRHHKIAFDSFKGWQQEEGGPRDDVDELGDWYSDLVLTEPYDRLLKAIARDVFFTLFQDRTILYLLNELIATHMDQAEVTDDEIAPLVTARGRAKRQKTPEWAARAVFYRDRGRCCFCQKDLTGLLSPQFASHLDHIVPLANNGINDVTNLQLLCDRCNTSKGKKTIPATDVYEAWYDDKEE
jgi:hypothetical protein